MASAAPAWHRRRHPSRRPCTAAERAPLAQASAGLSANERTEWVLTQKEALHECVKMLVEPYPHGAGLLADKVGGCGAGLLLRTGHRALH
jgi:hypothetical protein